jgi:hypothetical protein
MNKIILLALLLTPLCFSACGDSEEEANGVTVDFFVSGVFLSEYPVSDPSSTDTTFELISPPSFQLRFVFTNNTENRLIVNEMIAEITGNDVNGDTQTVNWSPGILNDSGVIANLEPSTSSGIITTYPDSLPGSERPSYSVEVRFRGYFSGEDDPDTTINESEIPLRNFTEIIRFRTRFE